MEPPIAIPAGLFSAGASGAGGQLEPLNPAGIKRYIFTMGNRHVIYGLKFNEGFVPSADTTIIDCLYDGICIKDPHAQTPMIFVTDYPSQRDRGLWYGYFEPPRYTKYSDPGIHKIQIKVAPRKTAQYFRHRDFSVEAGGVISPEYRLLILPDPE
jgi:hypothetical protein